MVAVETGSFFAFSSSDSSSAVRCRSSFSSRQSKIVCPCLVRCSPDTESPPLKVKFVQITSEICTDVQVKFGALRRRGLSVCYDIRIRYILPYFGDHDSPKLLLFFTAFGSENAFCQHCTEFSLPSGLRQRDTDRSRYLALHFGDPEETLP